MTGQVVLSMHCWMLVFCMGVFHLYLSQTCLGVMRCFADTTCVCALEYCGVYSTCTLGDSCGLC